MLSSNILVFCCSVCFCLNSVCFPAHFLCACVLTFHQTIRNSFSLPSFSILHTLFDKLPLQNGPSGFSFHGNLSPVGTCWEKSIIMSPFASWCEKAAKEARKRVRETHTSSSGKRVCLQSGSAATGGNALLCSL